MPPPVVALHTVPEDLPPPAPREWWWYRITAAGYLLIFCVAISTVVLINNVSIREALRFVEFMRLQHAHSDINDLVFNPIDRYQPFIVTFPAIRLEKCAYLTHVLATSGDCWHGHIKALPVAARSTQFHQMRGNYCMMVDSGY